MTLCIQVLFQRNLNFEKLRDIECGDSSELMNAPSIGLVKVQRFEFKRAILDFCMCVYFHN